MNEDSEETQNGDIWHRPTVTTADLDDTAQDIGLAQDGLSSESW